VDWVAVTAIATSILAVSLVGAIGAALFAAQQVREARRSREAQMAAEFFRRWNEEPLVEARRMVGRFQSAEELRDAYTGYVARRGFHRFRDTMSRFLLDPLIEPGQPIELAASASRRGARWARKQGAWPALQASDR